MKKNDINFVLLDDKRKNKSNYSLACLLLSLYQFLYQKRKLALTYTFKPVYMNFKKSICKKIGRYYYLCLFIIPTLLLLKILFSFKPIFWWWLHVVLIGICFVISLIKLIKDIICKIRIKIFDSSIEKNKSIQMSFGNPGAGKTSSILYKMKILADMMWNEICIQFKLLEPYLNQVKFFPALNKDRAEEIIEAYNYYKNSGTYPCLWTSIPCFVDGVPTNILEGDHLAQQERLPYGSVCVIDEARAIIPPELHRTNPDSILFMAKFCRHYGDFHFGLTDQAKEGAFNAWRRCSAENIFIEKQKWILKPKFLIWLKDKLILNLKKPTKFKTTILRILEKLISCIGYRKYFYSSFGNEYIQNISTTKTFILPPFLNVDYDDRSCRKSYMCLGKPLTVKKWTSLELTKEQSDKIFSSKTIKELMKGKKEKRREKTQNKNNKE